jgi:hypothetical protein
MLTNAIAVEQNLAPEGWTAEFYGKIGLCVYDGIDCGFVSIRLGAQKKRLQCVDGVCASGINVNRQLKSTELHLPTGNRIDYSRYGWVALDDSQKLVAA